MRSVPRFLGALCGLLLPAPLFGCESSPEPLRIYVLSDLTVPSEVDAVRVEVGAEPHKDEPNCKGANRLSASANTQAGMLVESAQHEKGQTTHVRVTLCQEGKPLFVRQASTQAGPLTVVFSRACVEDQCSAAGPCTLTSCKAASCGAGLPPCAETHPLGCAHPKADAAQCSPITCAHAECLALAQGPEAPDASEDAAQHASADAGPQTPTNDGGTKPAISCGIGERNVTGPLVGWTIRTAAQAQDPQVLERLRKQDWTALRLRVELDGDLWGLGRDFASLEQLLELTKGKTLLVQFGTVGTTWRGSLALDGNRNNYFYEDELASYKAFVRDLLEAAGERPQQVILGAFRRPHRRLDANYGEPANAPSAWLGRPSFSPPEGVLIGDSARWSGGYGSNFRALHETLRSVAPKAFVSSNGVDGRITSSDFLPAEQEKAWLPGWVTAAAELSDVSDLHLLARDLPPHQGEDIAETLKQVRKLASELSSERGTPCYVIGETPADYSPVHAPMAPPTTEQARFMRGLIDALSKENQGFVGLISSAAPQTELGFWNPDYQYEPELPDAGL